jgi:hypothetical protein
MDIADDTFVVAAPVAVAAVVADPASWLTWWPDLALTVTRDRGIKGLQWSVRGAAVGSMEVWLEPWGDGVIVHWYVRAALVPGVRRPAHERAERVLRWKREIHRLKDRLEAGREPGSPRACDGASAGSRIGPNLPNPPGWAP